MKELVAVFLGAGLGGVLRFYMGKGVEAVWKTSFPIGTFLVNLLACFLLGLLIGYANQKEAFPTLWKLFLGVGFCGGFSTFSTYSIEALSLIQQGREGQFFTYILAGTGLCLLATFGGMILGEKI